MFNVKMHCIITIVEKMYGIYTGQRNYDYDGVRVLPVQTFLEQLHSGKVF
jgi:hypothetical protein